MILTLMLTCIKWRKKTTKVSDGKMSDGVDSSEMQNITANTSEVKYI